MQATWVLTLEDGNDGRVASVEPTGGRPIRIPLTGDPAAQVASLRSALTVPVQQAAAQGPLTLALADQAWLPAAVLGGLAPQGWSDLTVASRLQVVDERDSPATADADAGPEPAADPVVLAPAQSPKPVPGPEGSFEDACYELRKWASFEGADHPQTRRYYQLVCDHPLRPDATTAKARADRAVTQGLRITEWQNRLYRAARERGAAHPEVRALFQRACQEVTWWRGFRRKAETSLQKGDDARARAQSARQTTLPGVRPSSIDHRLQALSPSDRWTLLIDETGDMPTHTAQTTSDKSPGRFVGLLIPATCQLPALRPGWHAVDERDVAEIDRVVQRVLDAPVGVIGFEVTALPTGQLDAWSQGVLEVIRWVCRLMPIAGPTHLDVLVEQRGEHTAGASWNVAAGEILRQGLRADADRYRNLEMVVRLINKAGSPHNGYVDAVAFTWGSPQFHSKKRLQDSGLLGRCLHQGDAVAMNRTWETVNDGRPLSDQQWRGLLRHPEARTKGSLAFILLERLQAQCQADAALWRQLFNEARGHLGSKAVDLLDLGRQVGFLSTCMPDGQTMLPTLRLSWLTAQLEQANHLGAIDQGHVAELTALSDRLFEEDPALVCQAELVRAVLATNRFDFDEAGDTLTRWTEQPPSVPGLQHWGRVWSSLGQHQAFRGHPEAAGACFDKALAAFDRLSDPGLAAGEKAQTSSYRAIAAMDDTQLDPLRRRAVVEAVVALDIGAITAMAGNGTAQDKYRHHLLLRYLVSHGTAEERQAYLSAREAWASGDGHPWPLIDWYRGWLLHQAGERELAAERMIAAVDNATAVDQGPTVRFIGLALAVAARQLGVDLALPDEDAVRRVLPLAPWSTLAAAAERGGATEVLATLAATLPFNFR